MRELVADRGQVLVTDTAAIIIAHYEEDVIDVLIDRAYGFDEELSELACELADCLGMDPTDAAALLYRTYRTGIDVLKALYT